MRIITVANKKGGVAKTTTAQNLAACLARMGGKILAVDMDPQGNLTRSWGISAPERTILDVLRRKAAWREIVVPAERGGGDGVVLLAAAGRSLAAMPEIFAQEIGREMLLKEALAELEGVADTVIIDSPPGLDLIAVNTYVAATDLLVPIQCEFYALEGLGLMEDDLRRVRSRLNPGLRVLGLVPTFVDRRKRLCRDVLARLEGHAGFGPLLTRSVIRDNVALAEAPSNGKSIFGYDPKSYGALDYEALGREIAARLEVENGRS